MSRRRPSRMAADFEVDPAELAAAYARGPGDVWNEPFGGESRTELELLEELDYDPSVPPALRKGYHFYPRDDGEEVERISARYLQRGDVDKPPPKTAGRSSGGGGAGRARKVTVPAAADRALSAINDEPENTHLPRVRTKLSRGVWIFYERRPAEARTVLELCAARLLAVGFTAIDAEFEYLDGLDLARPSKELFVWNLSWAHSDALKIRRGIVSRALTHNALRSDRDRVLSVDLRSV